MRTKKFKTLIEPLIPSMRWRALQLVGNKDTADDLVQDTLVKVFTCLDQYSESKGKIHTWLYTVLHNEYVSSYRIKKRHQEKRGSYLEHYIHTHENDIPDFFIEELNQVVTEVLSVEEQKILSMFVAGESYQKISIQLGIPLGTLKSRFHRAKHKVLEAYKSKEKQI